MLALRLQHDQEAGDLGDGKRCWKKMLETGASLCELSGDITSFDKKRNLLQGLPSPICGQIHDLSGKHLVSWMEVYKPIQFGIDISV